MEAKKYMYAAVGAPVATAKKLQERADDMRGKLMENATSFSKDAQKQIDAWATEGESLVAKVTEGNVVDELTAKVDFDQVQEQVTKLRDQLEDLLATWRSNFRPAAEAKTGAAPAAAEPSAKKPAAKKTTTAAKKPAAKKTTTAAKKPAAKKTTTAAKKPAAKKTTTAAKKPAAQKAS